MTMIDSPYKKMIKNKKGTTNPIYKKNNKCFQYAVTVAVSHEVIKKDQQRITKIKPFINIIRKEQIFHQKKMIGKNLRILI